MSFGRVNQPDPVMLYIYWDYSNIFIEAQHIAQTTEKEYGDDACYRVRLHFKISFNLSGKVDK